MPVLPFIDLLILVAWTSLIWAVFHKAAMLAVAKRFTVIGLGPFEFVVIAGVCLLFALTLAARVWVKASEGRLLAARRGIDEGATPYDFDPELPAADAAEAQSESSPAS